MTPFWFCPVNRRGFVVVSHRANVFYPLSGSHVGIVFYAINGSQSFDVFYPHHGSQITLVFYEVAGNKDQACKVQVSLTGIKAGSIMFLALRNAVLSLSICSACALITLFCSKIILSFFESCSCNSEIVT